MTYAVIKTGGKQSRLAAHDLNTHETRLGEGGPKVGGGVN